MLKYLQTHQVWRKDKKNYQTFAVKHSDGTIEERMRKFFFKQNWNMPIKFSTHGMEKFKYPLFSSAQKLKMKNDWIF